MKKILALVSLLILAAACAPQPSGNKDVTVNANSNANKSSDTKTSAAPSEADIIAKEKAAWDTFRKKDADAFGKLVAADYIEVTDTGVSDKATTIAGMKDFRIGAATRRLPRFRWTWTRKQRVRSRRKPPECPFVAAEPRAGRRRERRRLRRRIERVRLAHPAVLHVFRRVG